MLLWALGRLASESLLPASELAPSPRPFPLAVRPAAREACRPSPPPAGSTPAMGFLENFFTYETPKSVVVKSWTVGVLNRLMQLLIIVYFVGWVFLHEKAYQTKETNIESSVITKVKGFGRAHFKNDSEHVLDVADYVIPPQGSSVFCIITAMRITDNQLQDVCPEDPSNEQYICQDDKNCSLTTHQVGNGVLTGRCVSYNSSLKVCEVKGWCPVEQDNSPKVRMTGAENFTIFIKNSIRFPMFKFAKGNMLPSITPDYIQHCLYHRLTDPFCPIFRLGDIVAEARQDFNFLAKKGGVIGVKILWNCNLDRSADLCIPRYSFQRLDRISQDNNVSQGYNFRYARYYRGSNGKEYRTLIKSYGIRIDILVLGQAAKFDIIPTLINVVAAFTSVGLGAVICDLILLNFMKGAERYKARKFEEVPNNGRDHSVRCPMSHEPTATLPHPLRGHLQMVDGPHPSPPARTQSWGGRSVGV